MTSEKALELLKQRIIAGKGKEDFDLLYKKYYDVIIKDLEVLETLKKYIIITYNFNSDNQCIKFRRYIFNDNIDTEKDFKKIREWLLEEYNGNRKEITE